MGRLVVDLCAILAMDGRNVCSLCVLHLFRVMFVKMPVIVVNNVDFTRRFSAYSKQITWPTWQQ